MLFMESWSTILSEGTGTTWEEWYNIVAERLNEAIEEYQKDPTVSAINDVFTALQQSPPVRPVVYIDLPKEYGSGREYDARQVREIVAWLTRKTFDRFRPLQPDFLNRMPTNIRQRYEQLKTQVSHHKESIEQFNNIAVKLEQAEKVLSH